MKTITFYSYKGGVGRTLALANVARYLALLGKRVLCADFDLEAPGLHYKFGISRENIPGGTVDLVADFLEDGRLRNRIEDLAVEVDVGEIRGAVQLLAAGSAPHPDYWKTLGNIDWHRLFFDNRASGRPQGIDLFLEIQQQIEDALQPDYLLIDARTGITEVGGVALSLLADAVVCILAHNRENLDGARSVLRSVQAAPRLVAGHNIRLLPVLSRIPTGLEADEEAELLQSTQDFLNEPTKSDASQLRIDHVFILHSEPRLQVHEALKVPEAGAVEESTLLRDYLELFREIIPREDVVDGLEPLLSRARQRAFDDPDAAQGEVESLALLYPSRETALAQLKLYILRNLSPDRLLAAAQRLYEVTEDPMEPALLAVVSQNHEHIDPPDSTAMQMAVRVWGAQAPENGKLATALVEKVGDLSIIERMTDVGLHQVKRPDGSLAAAIIRAYIRCGDAERAAGLANRFMWTLGRETNFLEARVAATVELGDKEAAAALVDELEPIRERLTKQSWTRLLISAGQLSGPGKELLARVDRFLASIEKGNFSTRSLEAASVLLHDLSATASEDLFLEPLRKSDQHRARWIHTKLTGRQKADSNTSLRR